MKRTGKRLASLALALILLLAVLPGGVLAADLKVNSISADKPSATVGQKITWTATASGGTGSYRYCFYVFKDNKILERGSYGTANTYSYTPTAGGSYTVRVYVKDSANTAVNKMSTAITVSAAPITVSIAADRTSAAAGTKITWTAAASGGTGSFRYCFYLFKDGKILERGSYGTAKTYEYTPAAGGAYTVRVYAKDSTGTVVNRMSAAVSVTNAPITVSIAADKTRATVNETITWTATASGGTGSYQYCFYLFKDGKIKQRGSYGAAKTCSYTPTEGGTYTVRVYVKDSAGTAKPQEGGQCVVFVPILLAKFNVPMGGMPESCSLEWSVDVVGGTGTLQYCFYLYRYNSTKDAWEFYERSDYSESNAHTFCPGLPGYYRAKVYVKDRVGTSVVFESEESVEVVTAVLNPIEVNSVTPSQTNAMSGDYITWTVDIYGGYYPQLYNYYLFIDGKITERSGWVTENTFSYTVEAWHTYHMRVYVKDILPETVPVVFEGTQDVFCSGA